MSTPEAHDALHRVNRYTALERVLVIVVIVAMLVGPTIAGVALYRQNDIRRTQHRLDCARVIANEQTAVVNGMTIAKARLDERYIEAQLIARQDPTQIAALAAELSGLAADLDQAIRRVQALPPTQTLVARRCPSVGE